MSRVTKQLKKLSLSSLLGDSHGSEKEDVHMKKFHHQDGKKKLPTIPTKEEQSSMKQSIRMRSPINTHHLTAYGPFFLEYSMLAEFNHLRKQRLPGIYAIPSCENPLVWYGVIFVRMGIYQDGVFRFKLNVPSNYPDGDCPAVTFTPPIFHPSVNPETGELDVKRAFKTWRPNVNHLWQILLYVRRIFYKIEATSPLNAEAAQLYEKSQEEFKERVGKDVEFAVENAYQSKDEDNDQHLIRFTEWNAEVHDPVLKDIVGEKEEEKAGKTNEHDNETGNDFEPKPNLSGMSFMEPGSVVIFSKDEYD